MAVMIFTTSGTVSSHISNTLAADGLDGSCLLIFVAAVEITFCVDFGGVAGGGVGTGADYPMATGYIGDTE